MPQTFEGRTTDADAPFLSATFWKEGLSVRGVVTKIFQVTTPAKAGEVQKPPQRCYVLALRDAIEVDGEEWDRVSVGNMAGFKMALEVARLQTLQLKDFVTITCDGVKPPKKEGYSPRVNFHLKVERP